MPRSFPFPSAALRTARAGLTLIELLIVIAILAMVTAATIPMLLSGVDQRRTREAARLVSSYISLVRAKSIENGRSYGVKFERAAVGSVLQPYANRLTSVEVPAPYSGDALTSVVTLGFDSNNNLPAITAFYSSSVSGAGLDSGWQNLVRVGDLIKFDYQGRVFQLLGPSGSVAGTLLSQAGFSNNGSMFCDLSAYDGSGALPGPLAVTPPASGTATGVAQYQIFRQPIKSPLPPLQMPDGTVVDLEHSGTGGNQCFAGPLAQPGATSPSTLFSSQSPNVYASPIVMFNTVGGVDLVYDGGSIGPAKGAICLLIGRRDEMEDVTYNAQLSTGVGSGTQSFAYLPPAAGAPGWKPNNLFDLNNLWVGIGSQTGQVTTAANMNMYTVMALLNQQGYSYGANSLPSPGAWPGPPSQYFSGGLSSQQLSQVQTGYQFARFNAIKGASLGGR